MVLELRVLVVISVLAHPSVLAALVVPAERQPPPPNQPGEPQRVSVKVSTSIVETANQAPAPDVVWPPSVATAADAIRLAAPNVIGFRQQRSVVPNYQSFAPIGSPVAKFSSNDAVEYPRQSFDSIDWNSVIRDQLSQSGRIQEQYTAAAAAVPSYDNSQFYKRSTSTSWQVATPQPVASPPDRSAAHQMAVAQQPLVASQIYGNLYSKQGETRQQPDNPQIFRLPARGNQMQQPLPRVSGAEPQEQATQMLQPAPPKQRCQKKSLARVLRNAKELLTGGLGVIERSAVSPGNMIGFGSGLLAAVIPVVALLLPEFNMRSLTGGGSNNNNIVARFGLQGRVESVMGWVERSIEHLPNFPRLHPQECVKRSICEAHNEPEKYGAIGFMLRLLFPATNLTSTDRMDDMEYKVVNKYRYAAGYGLSHRIDLNNGTGSTTACKEKYEDCLVSLLDVARNLVDVFVR